MRDKIKKVQSKYQQLAKGQTSNLKLEIQKRFNELAQAKKQADIKETDVEYMGDTSAAMLQGIPVRYHVILAVSAAFLLIAGIWANFAVLDVVTVGQGKVIPSRNMQTVQNLEGGIIKDIQIKIGEVVEPNQVLMIIDDTRFVSSMREEETQIFALKAKLERLTAETNGSTELVFTPDLDTKYPQYVSAERNLYDSRKK